ncbi:MAG TPA: ABC transporter permease, partial [Flavitalea sp.]|nr:ABC transporter permease [Flavitalea sp.]
MLWRSIFRSERFTVLNVFGLAVGFVSFIAIIIYVNNEYSYDRFNKKFKRIYRVNTDTKFGDKETKQAIAAAPMSSLLLKAYPEIENAVRILPGEARLNISQQVILEEKLAYCDGSIFDIFTLPFLYGNPKTALTEPNSVVLTESAAIKYFGKKNVLGNHIEFIEDSLTVAKTITGVMRDVPNESHFDFEVFGTLVDVPLSHNNNPASLFPFSTYLLLKNSREAGKLESKFPLLLKKYLPIGEIEKSG